MSFGGLLIHQVEVYRRQTNAVGQPLTDRFGQQLSVNPRQHEVGGETHIHTYPCRVNRGKGGLLMEERMVDVFQQTWVMYTDADVDIQADDAVRVLDELGNELVPLGKVKVKSAAAGFTGTHHLEFTIWAQSGPN